MRLMGMQWRDAGSCERERVLERRSGGDGGEENW
jgi:hypothetical protein